MQGREAVKPGYAEEHGTKRWSGRGSLIAPRSHVRRFCLGIPLYLIYFALIIGASAMADPATPDHGRVRMGVHLRSLSDINERESTFKATFDLWISSQRVMVSAQQLAFPDAVTPIALGKPIVEVEHNGTKYRQYRVIGTFQSPPPSSSDLVAGRRWLNLVVQVDNLSAPGLVLETSPAMSSVHPAAGARIKLADGVVEDKGQRFERRLAESLGNPLHTGDTYEQPTLIARYLVHMDAVSPRGLAQTVLGVGRWWSALLLALALGVLGLTRKLWPARKTRLAARLVIGTALYYELEALGLGVAAQIVEPSAMQMLLDLSNLLWWLLPAVWLQLALSTVVWPRLAQRTGHPVPAITRTLVPLVGTLFCVTLALHHVWGYSIEAVWAASGVLTIVLGFALQGLILDTFAGIFLGMERPFKLLQWIHVSELEGRETEGQVVDINWRSTRLLTRANNVVSIPNSCLTQAVITNFATPSPPSRLEVSIDLDSDIPVPMARRLIKEGILQAAGEGRILSRPEPQVVVQDTLADDKICYRAYFYVDLSLIAGTVATTDAMEAVIDRLAGQGIYGRVQLPASPEDYAAQASHPPAALRGYGPQIESEIAPHALLSDREIGLIQTSWAKVVPIADEAASLFYQRLFELDPSIRPLFRTDPAAQRRKLVGMLGIVVQGLGRLDRLMPTIQDLGLRHSSYGVETQHYDTVGTALLWTLETGLGEDFTEETKMAWLRAYQLLAAAMATPK